MSGMKSINVYDFCARCINGDAIPVDVIRGKDRISWASSLQKLSECGDYGVLSLRVYYVEVCRDNIKIHVK